MPAKKTKSKVRVPSKKPRRTDGVVEILPTDITSSPKTPLDSGGEPPQEGYNNVSDNCMQTPPVLDKHERKLEKHRQRTIKELHKAAARKSIMGRYQEPDEDKAAKGVRIRDGIHARERLLTAIARDIAPIDFTTINWKRRLSCVRDLKLFCETYLPEVFTLPWSDDQLKCIHKAEKVFIEGGKFCLALPRGSGKALWIKTPILTVDGWKTMDDVCAGDWVLDPYGYPTRVTATTGVMYDRPCYRIMFNTGEAIVADALHEWPVFGENHFLRTEQLEARMLVGCGSSYSRVLELKLIDSLPVKCIEVTAHLYQCGRSKIATHNSSLCQGAILWGTTYGWRKSAYFIGSTAVKASDTLKAIKTIWYRNILLRLDFPEIGYPFYRLENAWNLAPKQTYNHEPTHSQWGNKVVRYPSVLMTEEDVKCYQDHCPDFLTFVEDLGGWVTKNSGVYITTTGIDGNIRGEVTMHPMTMEQIRPDVVLLDDIQKDKKAESPTSCRTMIQIIDSAVQYLSAPGEHIAALMPCTVIREGDVSDTFLDRQRRPEWQGERCPMVYSWPPGITDYEITLETDAGKLWTKYGELRKLSFHLHGDPRLAKELYAMNRKVMDQDFVVAWKDRYTKRNENAHNIELSAQQHAMNLRLENPLSFPSEMQNRGRRDTKGLGMLTSQQLSERTVDIARGQLPANCQYLAAFVDVQDEIMFYVVMGVDTNFNGIITDYGTWPEVHTAMFYKYQTYEWSLLTREFFRAYPQYRHTATKTESGKPRAPREAKIYHALNQTISYLRSKKYQKQDEFNSQMTISRIGIDTRWGEASDVIKRFIKEVGVRELIPYHGQPFPPSNKQLEHWSRTPGWMFEDQLHPHIKEPLWVIRTYTGSGDHYLQVDVDRGKDFLFSRLSCPLGSPGSIALYKANPDQHLMFSQHVCDSEYPEPTTQKGYTKNLWQEVDGMRGENDFLDCSVGCCALLSVMGASLKTAGDIARLPIRRSLREQYDRKKRDRERAGVSFVRD